MTRKRRVTFRSLLVSIRKWIRINGIVHPKELGGTLHMIRNQDTSFIKTLSTADLQSILENIKS